MWTTVESLGTNWKHGVGQADAGVEPRSPCLLSFQDRDVGKRLTLSVVNAMFAWGWRGESVTLWTSLPKTCHKEGQQTQKTESRWRPCDSTEYLHPLTDFAPPTAEGHYMRPRLKGMPGQMAPVQRWNVFVKQTSACGLVPLEMSCVVYLRLYWSTKVLQGFREQQSSHLTSLWGQTARKKGHLAPVKQPDFCLLAGHRPP